MGLNNLDPAKKKREDEIAQELFSYIDEKQSLVFSAGAGAGKTYALIESLRHVIKENGRRLKDNNQQIMCITYTNVAARNIKDKLGNSRLVAVSTIHERLWQLIEPYQDELLRIHKEKIDAELKKCEFSLIEDTKDEKVFRSYRELSEEDKRNFEKIVLDHQEEFYQKYSLPAKLFRDCYIEYIPDYKDLINNVDNFKKIVGQIYVKERYKQCLDMMGKKEQGYRKVKYDARYNQDRLYRMRISHDTLLEYSKKMVAQYPVLQQIIIDKYPYIFIDEYQDTAADVVEIMAVVDKRGKEIGHTAFVGYYGDSVQSIYEDGIGNRISEKHPDLKKVYKSFNRRSYEEIITVANRIRMDGLQQESIYADCKGGKVEYCAGDSYDSVLEKCKREWKDEEDKTIHCFLLKNEEVAEKTGISNIYNVFKGASVYKGANYNQLNTELLSNDREKLGKAASFLYRVLKLYTDIQEEETPVDEIFYGDITKYSRLDIQKLKNIKQQLKTIQGNTLDDVVKTMLECHDKGNADIKMIIQAVLDTETVSYPYIVAYLVQALESNHTKEENEENEEIVLEDLELNRVNQLLSIDIKEFEKWFFYVERKWRTDIVYHTYHGTKGLEFENVLIVLEDGFGRKTEEKIFIKKFLEDFDSLDEKSPMGDYEKARNLLYVAVTRAIKNLKVIYAGESEKVKETLGAIFSTEKIG